MYKNHPLSEAARYNDAQAEEVGLIEMISNHGLDPLAVVFVAQQRALRFVIVANYGEDAMHAIYSNNDMSSLQLTESDMQMIEEIAVAFIDGIMIGWRGNNIHSRSVAK